MASAWVNEFNDIIRDKIFADTELKSLMLIPSNTNIISFIDNYFIQMGYQTSKTLTDQDVRIVYGITASESSTPHILRNEISFDIYVKYDDLHNVGNDRLVFRTNLIADKLKTILTKDRLQGYKFTCIGESNMATSTIGYARYNVSFSYLKSV